jgi:hypothetical protein
VVTSFKKAGTATALAVPVALAVVAGIPSGSSVSAASTPLLPNGCSPADGPNGSKIYNNGGAGRTVHLTGVHLHVTTLAGKMFGLIPSTLTPTSPPPLIPGLPTPIPVVFTGVAQDNLELDAVSLSVPGYTVDVF